jgi:uncharacterized NAD-dependent epimerase/dehydratase family protein
MISLPYLIFLGDVEQLLFAKTGLGVRDWRPHACCGEWALAQAKVSLGLPKLTPQQAVKMGAKSLLIGVAPMGGHIPENWVEPLVQALEAGLDVVSGMHTKLETIAPIREAARRHGRSLHNVRHCETQFPVGTGIRRSGKRLLAVGTDCALGKKYTTLALTRAFMAAGHKATFRATGQTGIMISGSGIAIDAVVADFIAGAAEALSPANDPDHWDIIEGQGSLYHPAYAGVSLGLLHGSQPDALVLCHDPCRTEIVGCPGYHIPSLDEVMALHLALAKRTNAAAKFVAIALNTASESDLQSEEACQSVEAHFGLPTFDPMRSDLAPIVHAIVSQC